MVGGSSGRGCWLRDGCCVTSREQQAGCCVIQDVGLDGPSVAGSSGAYPPPPHSVIMVLYKEQNTGLVPTGPALVLGVPEPDCCHGAPHLPRARC